MTLAYFDASALIKLFIDEPGSDDAAELWDGADMVFTSRVADSEVAAALAAAHRSNRLDSPSHARARRNWDRFRGSLRFVELTAELARVAGDLAAAHALGSLDAIHLASAVVLSEGDLVVATWDVRLGQAVRANGLATLPAE